MSVKLLLINLFSLRSHTPSALDSAVDTPQQSGAGSIRKSLDAKLKAQLEERKVILGS